MVVLDRIALRKIIRTGVETETPNSPLVGLALFTVGGELSKSELRMHQITPPKVATKSNVTAKIRVNARRAGKLAKGNLNSRKRTHTSQIRRGIRRGGASKVICTKLVSSQTQAISSEQPETQNSMETLPANG